MVAFLTSCGIAEPGTGVCTSGDQMSPSDVPLAANTCDGEPGVNTFSDDRLGADWATLTTQPAIDTAPTVTAHTISTTVNATNRFSGDPRLRRRRRCRSRRLIGSVRACRGPRPDGPGQRRARDQAAWPRGSL